MVVVLVLVVVPGGGGVFRRSKNASNRHYQLQLAPYKQKHTIDKPSITKLHFTRHAGKARGLERLESCALVEILQRPPKSYELIIMGT